MATMIEKVARALCVEKSMNPDWLILVEPKSDAYPAWRTYIPQARAAIEAMREPSDAMIAEGCNSGEFEDRGIVAQPGAAKHVFTSMIDAALAEG